MNQEVQNRYGYDEEIHLLDVFQILLKSWKKIVVIFLITVAVVGSVTYFFIPKKYRSYTIFTYEVKDEVDGEAEISFGLSFGQLNMVRDVIHSNYFLKLILEKAGMGVNQEAINGLRSAITVGTTEAKNIRLQIVWDNPQKAYELLVLIKDTYHAQVVERINVYTAKKLRVAENNFNRNKEAFEQVIQALADFQKRNNIVFFPQNLVISDQFYLDLKRQMTISPESIAEYEKLVAEHAAAKENYIKAYGILEDTRREIEIERNYLFVTIEPPVFLEQKYSPSTFKNTVIAGVLALFAGVMLAFLRDYLYKYKEREQVVNTSQGC